MRFSDTMMRALRVLSGPRVRKELGSENAKCNRGGGIRTHDLLVPNQTRYRTALRPAVMLGHSKQVQTHRRTGASARC
jgi:hypothetical protein